MRKRTCSIIGSIITCVLSIAGAADLYVSPTGNDVSAGTLTSPLATIAAARDKADQLKVNNTPVNVYLRGGTYYLGAPLVFGPSNSGTGQAPITYAAYPGEKPVISGGIKLPDTLTWTVSKGQIMVAKIAANLKVDQLFLNGKRQILARYPNFNSNTVILDGYDANCISPARVATWANPAEGPGYVRALHPNQWGGESYIITGKNSDNTLQMKWCGDNNNDSIMHPTYRMVENIFEELDAAGEWFYRRSTGQLYFYPPAGTDLKTATIELASLDTLVKIVGTTSARVANLDFNGLTFTHTFRTLFSCPYVPVLRSDWHIAIVGAVFLENTEFIRMENCFFDQIGGNGIFMNGYNRYNVVSRNTFVDAGASCVNIHGLPSAVRCPFLWSTTTACTDRTPGPLTNDYAAFITVENNTMNHFGRFEKQTAGVDLAITECDTIRHNTMYDCPRAAINISTGRFGGHEISYNWLYNTLLETEDHGPFNSWGRDRNLDFKDDTSMTTVDAWITTIIHNNRFETRSYHFGIDLDDQSSNYLQHDNLLIGGGLKLQWSRKNTYLNNIIVKGGTAQFHSVWSLSRHYAARNILVGQGLYGTCCYPAGTNIPSAIKSCIAQFDSNVVYDPKGNPPIITPDTDPNTTLYTWAQWQAAGLDVHSIVADPQFTDTNKTWPNYAPKGDYSVKNGSPAQTLGFRNFPMDSFGVMPAVTGAGIEDPFDDRRNKHYSAPNIIRYEPGRLIVSGSADYRVTVTNALGKTVRVFNGKGVSYFAISPDMIAKGVYFATVNDVHGMVTRRLLVD